MIVKGTSEPVGMLREGRFVLLLEDLVAICVFTSSQRFCNPGDVLARLRRLVSDR